MSNNNYEEKMSDSKSEVTKTELSDDMLDDVTGGNLTQQYREVRSAVGMKSNVTGMKSNVTGMKSDAQVMKS